MNQSWKIIYFSRYIIEIKIEIIRNNTKGIRMDKL